MSNEKQLLHISTNSDSLIRVIQHLLKSSPNLDVEVPGTAGHFGLKLAVHIQSIQSLDHIATLLEQDITSEEVEEELNHSFRHLYSITYLPLGKHCLARILSMGTYLASVLSCLWYPAKLADFDPVQSTPVVKPSSASVKESDDQKSESDSKTAESEITLYSKQAL